jgi:hypothetical protein
MLQRVRRVADSETASTEEQNQNHSRNSSAGWQEGSAMQQSPRSVGSRHLIAHPGDAINPLEYGKLGLDHSISAALEHGEITEKSRVHKCILSDRDPYRYRVCTLYRVDCIIRSSTS